MRLLGTLLAATAVFCSASASAAIMQASINGDWNDNPGRISWEVNLQYDSKLFLLEDTGYTRSYWWDSSLGTPSPLISASGVFRGCVPSVEPDSGHGCQDEDEPVVDKFDLTEIDYISIRFGPSIDFGEGVETVSFSFSAPTVYAFGMGNYGPAGFKIDQPFSIPEDQFGDYGYAEVNGRDWGSIHTHGIEVVRLGPSVVPEPGAWALMIGGFGFAGAVLRRKKATTA